MKATGIVRRIDDLGRVVVPKEIRRTLRIREGDPLEIFVDREGEVILKKYSPINELSEFAQEYAHSLFDATGHKVLISDRDEFISCAGASKKEYLNKSIGEAIEKAMEKRETIVERNEYTLELVQGQEETVASFLIQPIVTNGDPVGSIIMYADKGSLTDVETKVCETAANFLARQME
ncbi:AbrB family transcriptional regulator (stage V sporulation protein T) [Alkalibacillus filiformis]|uniref:AbrB family transcriptional regulator (Stage V sporulation protein T) n=1 Tax=Alkalibacillus filiformis TaxID=200990 RepID=A0ABU0DWW7_9BACI|nr:stage V sporulation protein T [Alkalibacillus filiformis]MDQ0352660.1 AbrB family transcriptional regulator (stage V sporulation protein T) [Alkalibacillus filiformis]